MTCAALHWHSGRLLPGSLDFSVHLMTIRRLASILRNRYLGLSRYQTTSWLADGMSFPRQPHRMFDCRVIDEAMVRACRTTRFAETRRNVSSARHNLTILFVALPARMEVDLDDPG